MQLVKSSRKWLKAAAACGVMLALTAGTLAGETGTKPAEGHKQQRKHGVLAGPKVEGAAKEAGGRFGGKHAQGPGDQLRGVLAGMDLTEEQRGKIRQIFADSMAAHQQWRQQNAAEIQKLHEEAKAAREAQDRERAKAAMTKLQELRQSAPKPGAGLEQIKEVLTVEQRKVLEERLAARKAQMAEGKPRMMRDGQRKTEEGKVQRKAGEARTRPQQKEDGKHSSDRKLDL